MSVMEMNCLCGNPPCATTAEGKSLTLKKEVVPTVPLDKKQSVKMAWLRNVKRRCLKITGLSKSMVGPSRLAN